LGDDAVRKCKSHGVARGLGGEEWDEDAFKIRSLHISSKYNLEFHSEPELTH
jgi:hypothetical protein